MGNRLKRLEALALLCDSHDTKIFPLHLLALPVKGFPGFKLLAGDGL
jgi:hypothetical protein